MKLKDKSCVPCEESVRPMTPEEIQPYLNELQLKWEVVDNKMIRNKFTFKDFKQNMVFVNEIAELAEAEGHHPDLHIFYADLVIELSTHNIGGLSENDFILASKIESIPRNQ